MSQQKHHKLQVPHPARDTADGRARPDHVDPVATIELELVSTQALEETLRSNDPRSRASIERAAEHHGDGVLARDPVNGNFEIIDNDDLREILDAQAELPGQQRASDVTHSPSSGESTAASDELSLVSTQKLRAILGKPEEETLPEPSADLDAGKSFNPYDSG